MLSILIPVYNYNIVPLVEEIHNQATGLNIRFEIIAVDDASDKILTDINKVEAYNHISFISLKNNIGRSAIRNLLATKAIYDSILFIDAGTFPKSKNYIASYLNMLDKSVVIGGMIEEKKAPKKPYKLRWLYTKLRESSTNKNVLTSANFLIKKSIIENHPFDETITTYGYEDLLFFNNIKSDAIELHFIKNPVIHDCKDSANVFIKKTEQGLHNLVSLSKANGDLIVENRIIKLHRKLKSFGIDGLINYLFKLSKPLLMKNFNSSYPSILLFDFYKLGYFCTLKQKR